MVKSVVNGVTTYYPSAQYQQEVSGSTTTIQKTYVFGSLTVSVRTNGTLSWVMTDQISSTTVTASATGDLNSEIRYTAFGTIRYENGITPTDYRYTGQLQQAVIGLDYYNARWYDPQLGRFVQPDSAIATTTDPASYDRYAYVNNNPINKNDPTGYCPWCVMIVGGALVGALISYGTQVAGNIAANGWSVGALTNVNGAAIAAGAVSGAVGATVGLVGAALAGVGLVATVLTGAAAGIASGQAARATTNVLTGQDIGTGLGNPEDMLVEGTIGAATAGVGYGVNKIAQSFINGDFPEKSNLPYLFRKSQNGGPEGFASYNPETGQANYRVDLEGAAHGDIEMPHLHYANWNTPSGEEPYFNGWGKEAHVDVVPFNKIIATIVSSFIKMWQ
jgi:RHS repeat-associated protein